jgi:predicted site-specific integrase-resolvase
MNRDELPWPAYTRKQAAQKLGVSPDALDRFVTAGSKLKIFYVAGKSGSLVYWFNREDIWKIGKLMGAAGPPSQGARHR